MDRARSSVAIPMTFRSRYFCERGHDLEIVGRDPRTGQCRTCAAMLSRIQDKHDRGPRAPVTEDQSKECIRVNGLLELYDRKDRAATSWERNLIQQEINKLR